MVQLPKPFPRFFKLVDKPPTVPDSELAKARPIYIDGLPEGGGGSSTTEAITIEGITAEGIPETINGMPLNDYLAELGAGMSIIMGRLEALESAAG